MKAEHYPFVMRPLPYEYDALSPVLDEQTLYFHHDKHYKTYLDALNSLLEKSPLMQNVPLEALTRMGDEELQKNAGGTYNHELYFNSLTPDYKDPSANMRNLIITSFGSEKELEGEIVDMGTGHSGSGWLWLVFSPDRKLELVITPNQETIDFDKYVPLLIIDLWEHAYYLDKQNHRRDYLLDIMKLLDWEKAEARLNGVN